MAPGAGESDWAEAIEDLFSDSFSQIVDNNENLEYEELKTYHKVTPDEDEENQSLDRNCVKLK